MPDVRSGSGALCGSVDRFAAVAFADAAFDGITLPRQTVVSVATHFRAAIRKVFVPTFAQSRLTTATQRQLRRVRGQEFLALYALRRFTAIPAAIDGDTSIRILFGPRRGTLCMLALHIGV